MNKFAFFFLNKLILMKVYQKKFMSFCNKNRILYRNVAIFFILKIIHINHFFFCFNQIIKKI